LTDRPEVDAGQSVNPQPQAKVGPVDVGSDASVVATARKVATHYRELLDRPADA
jgi:hypothetical protein